MTLARFPVARSKKRIALPLPPVAKVFPSGEIATAVIGLPSALI